MYYYITSTKDVYELNIADTEIQIEEKRETEEEAEDTIIIHITGAVKNEGIVKVKENARINDVIESAGGTTEEADLQDVNLAYVVEDGQKIYIPFKTDKDIQEKGEIVSDGAGEKVLQEGEESGKTGKININTAKQEKLQELPGIRKFNSLKNRYISRRTRQIQNNRRHKKRIWHRRRQIRKHKRLYHSLNFFANINNLFNYIIRSRSTSNYSEQC